MSANSGRSLRRWLNRWTSAAPRSARKSAPLRRKLRLEGLEDRRVLAPLAWTPGASLPTATADARALGTGSVYLLGGTRSTGSTNAVLIQSGPQSAWGTSVTLDAAVRGEAVGWGRDSQGAYGIWVAGGGSVDAFSYIPLLGDANSLPILSTDHSYGAYAQDSSGQLIIIGGQDGSTVKNTVEIIVSASSKTTGANMPLALTHLSGVNDGADFIYTFGGSTTSTSTAGSTNVLRYDVANNSWTTMTPMPIATRDSAVVLGLNGLIYVVGGQNSTGYLSTVQVYDTNTDTWSTESPLPIAVAGAAATFTYDNRLELIGGRNSSGLLTNVYYTQNLSLADVAPAITSAVPGQTLATKPVVGVAWSATATATGQPAPTFSLSTAPAGMTINYYTGQISYTPTAGQVGVQNVTVVATNFAGATSQSFSLDVLAVPPDLTPPTTPTGLTQTSATTSSVTLSWTASTDNVAVTSYQVYSVHTGGTRWHRVTTYTPVGSPVSGTTATITQAAGTTVRYAVRAFDANANASPNSLILSATAYIVPQISINYLSYIYGYSTTTYTPIATADHAFALSLYASGIPAPTVSIVNAPAAMTLTGTTLNWSPTSADVGDHTVTVRATNIAGSADLTFNLHVNANLPQLSYAFSSSTNVISTPFAQSGQPFALQLHENYSGVPDTFTLDSGPAGVNVDPVSGAVTWTPTDADVGNQTLVFRVTNYAGSATVTLNMPVYGVGIDLSSPTAPSNLTVSKISTGQYGLMWTPATDNVAVDHYDITIRWGFRSRGWHYTYQHVTAAGDASTATISLPQVRSYTVYITAYDAAGNRSGVSNVITVTGG